jgi:hypothetical protein
MPPSAILRRTGGFGRVIVCGRLFSCCRRAFPTPPADAEDREGDHDEHRQDVRGSSGTVLRSDEICCPHLAVHALPFSAGCSASRRWQAKLTVAAMQPLMRRRDGESQTSRRRRLHSGRVPGALCGRWATLAWHGNSLLYSVTGKTLLLDTATRARPLDLTRLVHELAPQGSLRSIAWA